MMRGVTSGDRPTLSPEEAFDVLGSEKRLEILRTLVEAGRPLTFSALLERVSTRDSGQFNYHLDKLKGHFIMKAEDGYVVREEGRRVIQAVLSGAITEHPVLQPTPIDEPCPHCDDRPVVAFHQGRVEQYCHGCTGHYDHEATSDELIGSRQFGYLGSYSLPPAGLRGRTANEVQQAALTWGTLEYLALASGLCPRCSAALARSADICEGHEATSELCDQCGNRHVVQFQTRCSNCFFEQDGAFALALMANSDVLEFLLTHGINPVKPQSYEEFDAALMDYGEEVRSVDPLDASFTFTVDGDSLTLTVSDEHSVTDATSGDASESL